MEVAPARHLPRGLQACTHPARAHWTVRVVSLQVVCDSTDTNPSQTLLEMAAAAVDSLPRNPGPYDATFLLAGRPYTIRQLFEPEGLIWGPMHGKLGNAGNMQDMVS